MDVLLAEAEKQDKYRAKSQACELNQLARAEQLYESFFDPRATRYQAYVDTLSFVPDSTRIVSLHPSADSGFPHTRPGSLICLPFSTEEISAETLRHEALHISQRLHEREWYSYSIRQGWWPLPAETIPERWRNRCRLNPDTLTCPFWSWKDYYVPLPLFTNEWSPSLSGCQIRWFDLRNGTAYTEPPASFTERYGPIAQPEHPFETGAIEFAKRGNFTETQLLNTLHNE
jgi:hypothetical protein